MSEITSRPDANHEQPVPLSRRSLLSGAAAVTAAFASGSAMAGSEHSHHEANANEALIDAAFDCVKKGELCLDHCIELFKAKDTSLAACADAVNELRAMCGALAEMAAYDSTHLSKLASVCLQVCEDCEKECRMHEDAHVECKACAEACARCAEECRKVSA